MAPKTAAEKMRDYRNRMTEEKKTEMRRRNAELQKAIRKKWSSARRKVEGEGSKKRMRKTRERRKADTITQATPSKAFRSPQSFGKALQRAQRALPTSPNKKKAVVDRLATKYGVNKKTAAVVHRSTALDSATVELLKNFYESDIVSRQMPGRNDYITIRNSSGEKERLQKKILVMTIMEAYKQFKSDHPGLKIGKSKFAELRPKHVVPVTEKDHNVCCCIYHENGELILEGMRKVCPDFPKDINTLVLQSVCEWSVRCNFGNCPICRDIGKFMSELALRNESTSITNDPPISYYQWSSGGHFEKEKIETTLSTAQEELASQLVGLRRHCFIAKIQLEQIRQLRQSCVDGVGVLQEDFAENFALKHQNEVMSAHWQGSTISIFTALLSTKNKQTAIAIVTDELRHDKFTVFSCNKLIMSSTQQSEPIHRLHIFSDGAGSQFKNRYTLSFILSPEEIHNDLKEIDWSFFATSHGKGPIDGIGGTVKRAVWRRILQGSVVINNAADFVSVAKDACPNIVVLHLSVADLEKDRNVLEQRWNDNSPRPIPNTHQIHYVRKSGERSIETSYVSPFAPNVEVNFKETELFASTIPLKINPEVSAQETLKSKMETAGKELQVGNFVIVQYDGEKYPGIITDVHPETGDVHVSVLHKCRGGWHWPTPEDKTWYSLKNVLSSIDTPEPVNNRGVVQISIDI